MSVLLIRVANRDLDFLHVVRQWRVGHPYLFSVLAGSDIRDCAVSIFPIRMPGHGDRALTVHVQHGDERLGVKLERAVLKNRVQKLLKLLCLFRPDSGECSVPFVAGRDPF